MIVNSVPVKQPQKNHLLTTSLISTDKGSHLKASPSSFFVKESESATYL